MGRFAGQAGGLIMEGLGSYDKLGFDSCQVQDNTLYWLIILIVACAQISAL